MKKLLPIVAVATVCSLIGFFAAKFVFVAGQKIPFVPEKPKERILEKYSIESLAGASIPEGKLEISRENNSFTFEFNPALNGVKKKTSGQIRIPGSAKYPVVVMIRGYVDKEIFKPGIGTEHASQVFSKNGYITIAPDFLGYGDSDPESENLLEARFQTYTTILSLLASVDQIPEWDGRNIMIWAHSNGGQIALTALEATSKEYPTTLWAPVSEAFPYSVLYFTNELPDYGKYIRRQLAVFEQDYDVNRYSVLSYLERIKAPIQLHQGTLDESVPTKWSDSLAKKLKDLDVDINYFTYPGADHNMSPSWNLVVQRDLTFFKKNLK